MTITIVLDNAFILSFFVYCLEAIVRGLCLAGARRDSKGSVTILSPRVKRKHCPGGSAGNPEAF